MGVMVIQPITSIHYRPIGFRLSWIKSMFLSNFRLFNKQNLGLKKPYKHKGRIKMEIKPGQDLIILFRLKPYHYTQSLTIPVPKVYKL